MGEREGEREGIRKNVIKNIFKGKGYITFLIEVRLDGWRMTCRESSRWYFITSHAKPEHVNSAVSAALGDGGARTLGETWQNSQTNLN